MISASSMHTRLRDWALAQIRVAFEHLGRPSLLGLEAEGGERGDDLRFVEGLGTVDVKVVPRLAPSVVLVLGSDLPVMGVLAVDPASTCVRLTSRADVSVVCSLGDGALLFFRLKELRRWVDEHGAAYARCELLGCSSDRDEDVPTSRLVGIDVDMWELRRGGVGMPVLFLSDEQMLGARELVVVSRDGLLVAA